MDSSPRTLRAGILAPTLGLFALSLLAATAAFAETKIFDGGLDETGTTLDEPDNWSPNGLPTTSDEAVLDNSIITLPAALSTSTSQTFGDLIINSSTLTNLDQTGGGNDTITLSGGGGSTAAIAAGGATGDLFLLGSNVTGLVEVGATGDLRVGLGTSGNFNVVNSSAAVVFRDPVTGAFGLVKTGAGTVSLASSGAFTSLWIQNGTFGIASAAGVGTGTITLGVNGSSDNATLAVMQSPTITNNIVAQAGATGTLMVSARNTPGFATNTVQNPVFNGNFTLGSDLTLDQNRSSRSLTVNGVISGGATLNTTGAANNSVIVITNSGNATTFTGDVTIGVNTLNFTTNALGNGVSGEGDGAITFLGNGVLQWAADNTQDISNKTITAGADVTGRIDVGANDVSFATANGLTGAGNFNIQGNGDGSLTLNAANNYTGTTAIANGTVIAGVDSLSGQAGAFGNTTSAISLNAGGTLLTGGAVTIGRAVTTQGTSSALELGGNTDNASTFGGLITVLNSANLIISQVATTGANALHITGGITESGNNDKTVTFAGPGAIRVESNITDSGGDLAVEVTGGTVTFTGENTHARGTTINGGTLLVNNAAGSGTGTGAVTVNAGGTLGGTGTIGGATTILAGGILSPGSSPGTLSFTNNLTLATDSAFVFELNADTDWPLDRGITFDGINVGGTGVLAIQSGAVSNLVFNGENSTVDFTDDSFWGTDHSWLVFDNASLPTLASGSIFDTVNISTDSNDVSFAATGGSLGWVQIGNDIYLRYEAIPEPGTLTLLGLGLASVLLRRRRK